MEDKGDAMEIVDMLEQTFEHHADHIGTCHVGHMATPSSIVRAPSPSISTIWKDGMFPVCISSWAAAETRFVHAWSQADLKFSPARFEAFLVESPE